MIFVVRYFASCLILMSADFPSDYLFPPFIWKWVLAAAAQKLIKRPGWLERKFALFWKPAIGWAERAKGGPPSKS